MAQSVRENASLVLQFLASQPRDDMGELYVKGHKIQEMTGLSPAEVNDAVSILVDADYADWLQYFGTAPFVFGEVTITPRGRYEAERLRQEQSEEAPVPITRPPSPRGSPYGFEEEDWEFVSERKDDASSIYVVLGYQFESKHYHSEKLKENVEIMFNKSIDEYNKLPQSIPIALHFEALGAGYGEHLFNEIARSIISADIAVFETSDLNPNVMIEMGVALTWGVRVLPIKKRGTLKPPSDISGQTYADYEVNASKFFDSAHRQKLLRMVKRAAQRKSAIRNG